MSIFFRTYLEGEIEDLVSQKITDKEVEVNLREDKHKIIYQEINEKTFKLEEGDKFSPFLEKEVIQYIYVYKIQSIYKIYYIVLGNSLCDGIENFKVTKEKNIDFVKKFNLSFVKREDVYIDGIRIKVSEKKEYVEGKIIQTGMYLDLSYKFENEYSQEI